jgi:hypothetical protein
VTHPLSPLAAALGRHRVRYVMIGISAANLYGPDGQAIFATEDIDLFLPLDADNLVAAWAACDETALELWSNNEPLDRPRDRFLAQRVIERRALTRARGANQLIVDFTLVMKGFDFETVWNERREFLMDDVPVLAARLLHIVESKQATGREKDQLFLATHLDALQQLLKKSDLQ